MKKNRNTVADIVIDYIASKTNDIAVNESDSFESLGLGIYEAAQFTYKMESIFKIKYSDTMLLNFEKKSIEEIINNIYVKI